MLVLFTSHDRCPLRHGLHFLLWYQNMDLSRIEVGGDQYEQANSQIELVTKQHWAHPLAPRRGPSDNAVAHTIIE